jgi:hypothetical protein
MGIRRDQKRGKQSVKEQEVRVPTPTASYRRRAWVEFQRALDPLAPIKKLPPPRD